jgi:hypothetical protein
VPPSTNATSSPAGLQRKVTRKEEVEVPRKAETRTKPLAMVGGISQQKKKYQKKKKKEKK